jgi:hypothetical protein
VSEQEAAHVRAIFIRGLSQIAVVFVMHDSSLSATLCGRAWILDSLDTFFQWRHHPRRGHRVRVRRVEHFLLLRAVRAVRLVCVSPDSVPLKEGMAYGVCCRVPMRRAVPLDSTIY